MNEIETCGRCGRKLKTEKSRQDGFGPVCKKKFELEAAMSKDQKITYEDLIELAGKIK